MAAVNRTVAVGVFDDRDNAREAVAELKQAGFTEDQIGVAARGYDRDYDETQYGDRTATDEDADDTYAGEGAVAGAVAGLGVGGLWAIGIAAGALPVIGPAIAGGLLASILTSAAAGAVAGGILGALIGLGIPEEEAEYYQEEFQQGRTIVTVRANGRYDEAVTILRRHGAYDYATRDTGIERNETAVPRTTAEAGRTMELKEEELHVQKRPVQTGEVDVRKEVVKENRTINVPVEREEVVIERHPVAGHEVAEGEIREGEEIRVPVKEERVDVDKDTVVREEVAVGKRKVQDTARVSDTLKKEQLRVEKEGDVD